MWKKTIGMFAIALLTLSIMAAALAESEDVDGVNLGTQNQADAEIGEGAQGSVEADTEGSANISGDVQHQTAQRAEHARELAKEHRVQFNERAKERFAQAREQMKERVERAKERFAQARERAKERYDQAKARYRTQHQKVESVRKKFVACKSDNTTECRAIRDIIKKNAQPFLLSSADLVLDALNRVEIQVKESADLSAETKADLLSKLDEKIQDVTNARVVIENLDNSSTPAEIRAAAKTIRKEWLGTKVILKKSVGHLINARLGNIIHQIEQLSTKIHATRDRLAAAGKDVSALDAKMDEFDAKLADARNEYRVVVNLYANASSGTIDEIAREAHDHVKAAQDDLKEVRDTLRDIVNEIRQQNGGSVDVEDDSAGADTTVENEATNMTESGNAGEESNETFNVTSNESANA